MICDCISNFSCAACFTPVCLPRRLKNQFKSALALAQIDMHRSHARERTSLKVTYP